MPPDRVQGEVASPVRSLWQALEGSWWETTQASRHWLWHEEVNGSPARVSAYPLQVLFFFLLGRLAI